MQRRPGSSGRQKRVTTGGSNTFRRGEGLGKDTKPAAPSNNGISALFKKLFSKGR